MRANPSNPALSPLKTRYEKQSRNPVIPTGHIGIIQLVILPISPIFLRIWRTKETAEPVKKCALAVAAIFPSAESSCYPRLEHATRIAATFPKTEKIAATGLPRFCCNLTAPHHAGAVPVRPGMIGGFHMCMYNDSSLTCN